MSDGDTSPKTKIDLDYSKCVSCHKYFYANELYGAHGMCSSCLETEGLGEHEGG